MTPARRRIPRSRLLNPHPLHGPLDDLFAERADEFVGDAVLQGLMQGETCADCVCDAKPCGKPWRMHSHEETSQARRFVMLNSVAYVGSLHNGHSAGAAAIVVRR